MEIAKSSVPDRTVTGWVTVVTGDDGQPIIDEEDHLLPVMVLEKAVQRAFARRSGQGAVGINHKPEHRRSADLVESFVVTAEKRAALGLGEGQREGWIATIKVSHPEPIRRVDSGELKELSLKGLGTGRVPADENMPIRIDHLELDSAELLSLVDEGASGDAQNRPEIVLWKRKKPSLVSRVIRALFKQAPQNKEEKTMDINAALDQLGLTDEQKTAILQLLEQIKAAQAAPAPAAVAEPVVAQSPEKKEDEPIEKRSPEVIELEKRHEEEKAALEQEKLDLAKRIGKLEDDRVTMELTKRAEALKWIPAKTSVVIELLKRAGDDKEILALLKRLNDAMRESPALREHGRPSHGDEITTLVEKRSHEIREEMAAAAKRGEKLTEQQAYKVVVERDPRLHQAEAIDARS
jgi:hypothetical protein